MSTSSNYSLDPNATYVVAGGLGGIGRAISRWLAQRGAKHLMLLSRSGASGSAASQELVDDLTADGVNVATPRCDIANLASLQAVVAECAQTMPPIKGCLQASMVLRDATFSNMSFSDWNLSTLAKVQGSWNLHAALPSGMDFFVMLSSVCGIFGNGGQSNYAAGNTYQDALSEYRRGAGEKSTTLDLGIILAEGWLAENRAVMDRLIRLGIFLLVNHADLFAMFDYYCNPALPLAATFQSQLVTGLELPANIQAAGSEIPGAMRNPLFAHMRQIDSRTQAVENAAAQGSDLKSAFRAAASDDEARDVVAEALRVKLSRMLGIAYKDIEVGHRIESLGVDSLVAVEVRNWLSKETAADVAVFEILGGATLVDLAHTVVTKSAVVHGAA